MSKRAFIDMNEQEAIARAKCGCSLSYNVHGCPVMFQCLMHEKAAALRDAANLVIARWDRGNLGEAVRTLAKVVQSIDIEGRLR